MRYDTAMPPLIEASSDFPGFEEGVNPNMDFLPAWIGDMLQTATGTAVMIGLIICIIGFVIAGVLLVVTRGRDQSSDVKTRPLQVIAATILIAAAPAFVTWFAGFAGDNGDEQQEEQEDEADAGADAGPTVLVAPPDIAV